MRTGGVFAGVACAVLWAGMAFGARTTTRSVARGTFELTMKPAAGANAAIGSMSISKVFEGDLRATSAGQMLAVRTPVAGSAGYVAMERVTGSLAGRHGSFVLQHSGTMTGGSASAAITVVPDSGADGFEGLKGSMTISQPGGVHHYEFDYDCLMSLVSGPGCVRSPRQRVLFSFA